MCVRSMSSYNVYSGRRSSENVPSSYGVRGCYSGKIKKKIGANMYIVVHFVDEIRIYGVQDRGVHGIENQTGM